MHRPAIHRSLKSYVDQAAKQERELQRLVYPNGAPAARGSAAQNLYPAHNSSSFRQVEFARRNTAPSSTLAELVYPNLARRENE
jgi:hypothetical protein